jgi:hypothetical protein
MKHRTSDGRDTMKPVQAYWIAIAAAQSASVKGGLLPATGRSQAVEALRHMGQRGNTGTAEVGFIDPSRGSMGARMR